MAKRCQQSLVSGSAACERRGPWEEPMALDVTRVTVLGGSRKRVTTRDRRGVMTERYEVRWRALLRSGESRMFRQRFDARPMASSEEAPRPRDPAVTSAADARTS